jgi:large subunit ribosomal protein L17
MLRNLASSLVLTERDAEFDDNEPKIKGRVVTTLAKAKEVRPLVEKCVTIARRSLGAQAEANKYGTDAERNSDAWRSWRESEDYRKWNAAIAPVVAARRRVLRLLGDKQAVQILFDEIATRYEDRPGGYTRVLRLATPRLGDAGTQAIIEFVGIRDRVTQRSEKPAFDDEESTPADEVADEVNEAAEESSAEVDEPTADAPAEETAESEAADDAKRE